MSTPDQPNPGGQPDPGSQADPGSQPTAGPVGYVLLSPLLADDPPKIGDFWLDSRLGATPAGVAYVGHVSTNAPVGDPNQPGGDTNQPGGDTNQPVMVILLSEGAAADAAARARLSGVINKLHIDTVIARGGQGQNEGRLAKKYRADDDDPPAPDDRLAAPWAALVYDGSPAAAAEASRILTEVQLSRLAPQGTPSGPDFRLYWIDRVKPGLARLWPLPWPGRFDRAGWTTILVSWLLMLLLSALAILVAILIFHNRPPQAPPPPAPPTGSPPPQSGSPPPQSGSPSPQSGSPSPQSGSPTQQSPTKTPSMSGSPQSGSPSPSGTQSGGGTPTQSDSGSPGGANSPGSEL